MPNLRLPNFLFCPLASNIIQLRKEEYRSRFRLKPHQSKYLDGWGYEMLRKTGQEWLYVANILMGFKFLILMGGAWQWIPEICWAFSRRCTLSICNRIAVAARGHTILWLNWLRSATWILRFLSWTGWKCFMSFKRVPSSLLTTWHHWQVWPCNWPTQIYSLEFESSSDTLT